MKSDLDSKCKPAGYNIGINSGAAAGQTVFHLHVHVIPRYEGDVDDPRGGVRHVIPEKGNYLAQSESDAGQLEAAQIALAPTPRESELAEQIDSAQLTQWLLSLIDKGSRTATYKPALLMALIELAMEQPLEDSSSPMTIPVTSIAERVIEFYWPQTRIHHGADLVLRQSTTQTSRIIGALVRLREESGADPRADIGHVRLTCPDAYTRAKETVEATLAMQPIPRLQRPGSSRGQVSLRHWRAIRQYCGWLFSPFGPATLPRLTDSILRIRNCGSSCSVPNGLASTRSPLVFENLDTQPAFGVDVGWRRRCRLITLFRGVTTPTMKSSTSF